MEKKSGRGRGRHKLYKEDTYISEPFESTGEFVVCVSICLHQIRSFYGRVLFSFFSEDLNTEVSRLSDLSIMRNFQ